ncbi:3498_t:CDS:2, partial [Funneliformis geosporum]
HWYECSNGHPYTIGECEGLAATVGGNSHNITSGNKLNVEFDTIGGRTRRHEDDNL